PALPGARQVDRTDRHPRNGLGSPEPSRRAGGKGTRTMAETSPDKTRTVADIMSRPVVTVSPDDKMAEAAATMREHRVGSVVAVDQLRPVGILTERDLVRFTASGGDAGAAVVSEWMTAAPDSGGPDRD